MVEITALHRFREGREWNEMLSPFAKKKWTYQRTLGLHPLDFTRDEHREATGMEIACSIDLAKLIVNRRIFSSSSCSFFCAGGCL